MLVQTPEKVLETIKDWINDHGKFNVEELSESTTYFTLKLSNRKDPEILALSVIYSRDFQLANAIIVGWAWKLRDIDRKAYAAIMNSNLKRNLVESIRSRCHSKGFSMSVEPNEDNLEAIRVSKQLQLEGLTKHEFTKSIKRRSTYVGTFVA